MVDVKFNSSEILPSQGRLSLSCLQRGCVNWFAMDSILVIVIEGFCQG